MRRRLTLAITLLVPIIAMPGQASAAGITGTSAGEVIFGTAGSDTLRGQGGSDLLLGGAGRDTIKVSGTGTSIALGGPGRDVIVSTATGPTYLMDEDGTAGDEITGGPESDEIYAADGAKDLVDCGKGVDTAFVDVNDRVRRCENVLRSSFADFYLVGDDAPNSIPSLGKSLILSGLRGNDSLSGSSAAVYHHPGAGTDVVAGGTGADFVYDADADPDTFNTDAGDDVVIGGSGTGTTIDCGAGTQDTAVVFTGDLTPTNCETVVTGLGQVQPGL